MIPPPDPRLPEQQLKYLEIPGFPQPVPVGIETPQKWIDKLVTTLKSRRQAFAFTWEVLKQPC